MASQRLSVLCRRTCRIQYLVGFDLYFLGANGYNRLLAVKRHPTLVIDATGYRTGTQYTLRGDVIAVTNANGETVKFEYDALGRKTAAVDPMGYPSAGNTGDHRVHRDLLQPATETGSPRLPVTRCLHAAIL